MVADLSVPVEAVTAADGTVTLTGTATSGPGRSWAGALYRTASTAEASAEPARPAEPAELVRWVARPYYQWANRGASAMRVWLPVTHGERG
jgi:DUF1680 family protein